MAEIDPDNVDTHVDTSLLNQLKDELRVQAWLASAELRNPSVGSPEGRAEVDMLARLRDELRLKMHLGKLEVQEEFDRLEGRFQRFMSLAERAADDAEERIHDVMKEIRDSYRSILHKRS